MEMLLAREPTLDDRTFGHLFVNGRFMAFSLEDAIRETKIAHETAIPAGRYPVTITRSQRFGRMLPLIGDVPGFDGIRFHPGNTTADTSGCVLVGLARSNTALLSSQAAMELLQPQIAKAIANGEPVWLTVINQPAEASLNA